MYIQWIVCSLKHCNKNIYNFMKFWILEKFLLYFFSNYRLELDDVNVHKA